MTNKVWFHFDFGAIVSCLFALILSVPIQVFAQHPIDIQRSSADGNHFAALAMFDKMPKRRSTLESRLAAANSAWGLGLADRAIKEFDEVLRDENVSDLDRAKTHLSRAIIEFQEHRFQVANLYAEKVLSLLVSPHSLRSKAWLLWGDSLYHLESFGAAEDKYLRALDEAAEQERSEIHYRLGICRVKLGDLESAKANFESVPLHHDLTSDSMRHLTRIALESGEYDHAAFWLEKAKADFSTQFLDSWVDYALVKISLEKDDLEKALRIRDAAAKKYPESDTWFTLLVSAIEIYQTKQIASEG